MESYCVIRFKDKQQKQQVLMQLMEMEVDLTLTTDLKKFLTDKFNVNTCVTASHSNSPTDYDQSHFLPRSHTNSIGRNIVAESWTDNYSCVTPLRNSETQPAQHRTEYVFLSHVAQHIPAPKNLRAIRTMDDYVVPKQEAKEGKEEVMIIDLSDDELIDNDSDDNMADDEFIPNQADVPSSSTTRRNKNSKRPNYLMHDDSDEEYTPSTKSSKKRKQVTKMINEKIPRKTKCIKCKIEVNNKYSAKLLHVMGPFHSDIARFECLVDNCGFKNSIRGNAQRHMARNHPTQLNDFREIQMTREKSTELGKLVRECFGSSEDNEHECQVCGQNAGGNCKNASYVKQDHSLSHLDFTIYKCLEPGCLFESQTERSMISHQSNGKCGKWAKDVAKENRYSKIELTNKQELEAEDMFAKCFPSL